MHLPDHSNSWLVEILQKGGGNMTAFQTNSWETRQYKSVALQPTIRTDFHRSHPLSVSNISLHTVAIGK